MATANKVPVPQTPMRRLSHAKNPPGDPPEMPPGCVEIRFAARSKATPARKRLCHDNHLRVEHNSTFLFLDLPLGMVPPSRRHDAE
ncbi:hypothetical protein NDU88_002730 [Pleurodeles waltl]|uniref:Uncharacterized protein n=1 Tax=Pleurodeles waltl TaxID=8319 RepID=A0AAV7L4A2_PLEWA|nr:hypothetical protein NDU88_002730 [Pleurodeles waltl]